MLKTQICTDSGSVMQMQQLEPPSYKFSALEREQNISRLGNKNSWITIKSLVDWFDEWTDCGHYPQRCHTHLL